MRQNIVGGEEAAPGEFPFMVSLQENGDHFCGGTLIERDLVLTAAHCMGGDFKVVVGLHTQGDLQNAEVLSVASATIHPKYDSAKSDFDFALVRLTSKSKFEPAAINRSELSIPETEKDAQRSITAGWGVTTEGGSLAKSLMKVEVPLVSPGRCDKAYPGQVTERMICAGLDAGQKDSCQGDSGGPLLTINEEGAYVLTGVVSWGEGCARAGKYGVYSKVSSVADWIGAR